MVNFGGKLKKKPLDLEIKPEDVWNKRGNRNKKLIKTNNVFNSHLKIS